MIVDNDLRLVLPLLNKLLGRWCLNLILLPFSVVLPFFTFILLPVV